MPPTKGQPVSKGFGVGLQIWLLFLISLYGLGYPALYSIALGAIGGVASGFIVDWWMTKEEDIEPKRIPISSDTGVEQETRLRKRRPNSALNHRKRRREREPVTIKTITKFFQRPQENQNEDS